MALRTLAVGGTGLIGASVGPAETLEEAVADAELAIVAAPVAALPTQVGAVLAASGDSTTVSDVGSTKGPVMREASDGRFIGGDPGWGPGGAGAAPRKGGRLPSAARRGS